MSGHADTAVGSADYYTIGPETKASLKILVVDDEHTLRESCANVLSLEGYSVTACGRGDEALVLLQRRAFDIVLLDLYMSHVPGMELLRTCLNTKPDTLVIIITGHPSLASSLEALRAGAWDYLPKPFSATQLDILVGRAAHAVLAARKARELKTEFERRHSHSEKITVLGVSPAFRKVIELARRVAPTDASVFISGESGTGKELIAQFIHHHSRRARKPLVAVNCAALTETLLESEVFGHVKGAFTGALRDKPGLLEIADGSTFFLDELTEMSPALQAKLLRVIQDGIVRRVGSEALGAMVDVRFIAATNREPREAIESGKLRQDLYYRLRVVPIRVPPLRERPEDIPVLARHFLHHFWTRHRGSTQIPRFTDAAIEALQARPWPGNVRELQNVIEHAVVLLEPGCEIQPEHIPFVNDEPVPSPRAEWSPGEGGEEKYHIARHRTLREFERRYFAWLVERTGGNMSRAARLAGVDRTTLYRLMEKHGLHREASFRSGKEVAHEDD